MTYDNDTDDDDDDDDDSIAPYAVKEKEKDVELKVHNNDNNKNRRNGNRFIVNQKLRQSSSLIKSETRYNVRYEHWFSKLEYPVVRSHANMGFWSLNISMS